MENRGLSYSFSAKIWYSEWYFVSLPKDLSGEIRTMNQPFEEGWGRLKVTAQIGQSDWKTAIWFDTKQQTYLLPVKKDIRMREKIGPDDEVAVTLWV